MVTVQMLLSSVVRTGVNAMKLFTYEIEGEASMGVRHICLHCDMPVLIDISRLKAGELYFCTHCGVEWRLAPVAAHDVAKQCLVLCELIESSLTKLKG